MDKKEIIRRLKRMSEHAVYMPGRLPFIMSLDDGVAADEAAMLLKEQDAVEPMKRTEQNEWTVCGVCENHLIAKWKFCPYCGRAVKWDG